MIKRFLLLSFLLSLLAATDVLPQSRLEIKKLFYEAESWILFEDYKEALPIYQQLLKINPTNSNYKYRIGQCYINTPGEKEKAVSYLEDAVKNISTDYKEGKFTETKAPFDAYYYLANAYRINNQIDKAIETYEIFRQKLNPVVYDSSIVNLQIQSCLNAKDLMQRPLFIKQSNMSRAINESNSEFNPVVSDNEDMIVFARSTAFYDAILYSVKSDGAWSGPMNMNEILKVDQDLLPTSLSKDGKTLYLYSSADYDGIIYSSHFENGTWSPIVKLNDNINTKYWESHATVSHDNKKLYFTSNRKGTLGGLDIYVSERDSTGDWGPAKNLGAVINTPYNEESPFLSQDDKTIFFSSRGHFNMGGYDIFYSTLLSDGTWSVPLNAGYPLNTTDDDVFFKPLKDGYVGYFSKEGADSYGKQDIYRIEIYSDNHPRKFLVRGIVKAADLIGNFNDSVKISAMNVKNPNQVVVVYSNPRTGEYEFELPQGNYEVSYEGDGTKKVTKQLDLALTNPSDSFVLPGTVLPKSDFIADLKVGTGQTISVSKGDSILFPLKVEPNSILRIERWSGDSLLSAEEIVMTDSIYNYKMLPRPGDSKVVFRLTDKFNNVATTEVFISRKKELPALIRPEYGRIIAQKQLDAFISMLKSRSSGELKNLIGDINTEKQKFGKLDDVLDWLKQEGSKKNISNDEVDRLAMKVAAMDNVLTQAAVNYLASHSDGELKKLLDELDIYESGLKTWTDLQKYIQEKSAGRISPEQLNSIVAGILADIDPAISTIREKVLEYGNHSDIGAIIRESVAAVDISNIKLRDRWLASLGHELIKEGLSNSQLAAMLAAISKLPGTTAEEFLSDLITVAEKPLLSSLNSLNLKKEKIKSPEDLVMYLLTNIDKARYPEDAVYKAIANLIIAKNIPGSAIADQTVVPEKHFPWVLILAAGGILLAIIFFFLFRRRKKESGEHE
ncbi:MAG TPA: tetratricopeptide repeat protein [Bacteroidales bacterium]|nr:tetratricopeptide repeat protein [Bacteroidales bacterium]